MTTTGRGQGQHAGKANNNKPSSTATIKAKMSERI